MTDDDKAKQLEQARRQMQAVELALAAAESRQSLVKFMQFIMPDPNRADEPTASLYKVAPHHRLLGEALEDVFSGKNLRLCISIGPQHGKSQMASRGFPAWAIGRKPHMNIMLGTYNQDFANEFGSDVRDIALSSRFKLAFPEFSFRSGSKAKDHMVTYHGGKLSFLGRGGAGTGRPADLFLIDDPLKDAKEAESPTIRNDVWEWFTKVAYTRCHAASAIVIIQTRWHEDDLIGRLTDPTNPYYNAEEAARWTYINIPTLFDDPRDEPIAKALGIEMGQPLWPERFSKDHLLSARRLNPIGFSALYQGRPTPPDGAFYKSDMFYGYNLSELPKNLTKYGSGDLAVSPERNADSSVIANWGVDKDGVAWLLPELYWQKKAADETVEQLIDFADRYQWLTFAGEKGVIDRAIGPFLNKRMQERGKYFHIEKFPTVGNKAARSLSIRGRMAQGKVRFPTFAPWWPAAREQMLKFTGSGGDREDDFCDTLGLFGQLLDIVLAGRGEVATVKQDKVVQIGTLRWIKEQDKHRRESETRAKARKGF